MKTLATSTFALLGIAVILATTACQKQNPEPGDSDAGSYRNSAMRKTTLGVERHLFGETKEHLAVYSYELTNDRGMSVEIMTYGATITAVRVPDRRGNVENVTLWLETLDEYLAGHSHVGSTIGRYANRIAKGKFTLNDAEYVLATNDGPNHLHGGNKGFDKVIWNAQPIYRVDDVGVAFSYTSPDREEGYPGRLSVKATYTLNNKNELTIDFEAKADEATYVNLTNHAYWNLAGATSGNILGQELQINAKEYLPVDNTLIPLGEPAPVAGSPMDFTTPHAIGERIVYVEGGYDHCYVLNKKKPDDLSLAAKVVEPKSGRVMEALTTQPGLQLYSGSFLDGSLKAEDHPYEKYAGFCLETEHFPDSPNHPDYPSTLLKPGQTYHETTIYRFSVQQGGGPKPKSTP